MSAFPSAGPRDSFDSEVFGNRSGRWRRHVQTTLLWSALLAGTAITLYRTDALFNGAKALKMESAFIELERSWFGGPPAGTPRQVKAMLYPEAATPEALGPTSAADSPIPGLAAAALANSLTTASGASAASAESTKGDGAADGEAEAEDSKQASAGEAETEPADTNPAKAKSRNAAPTKRASAAPKRNTRSASVSRSNSASTKTAVAKSEPAADDKPTPKPGSDAFLRLSIENAVKKDTKKSSGSSAAATKKSGSSYDPLNGDL